MARRVRLDAELARRKLAPSRTAAQQMIHAGEVVVEGVAVPKPSSQVTADQSIKLTRQTPRYASRGALKLLGALEDLAVDPAGRTALDAGAAHGGFTDVLLRRGAHHVIAVDVAYGQLAWELRTDDRVTLLERTNVRTLTPQALPDGRIADFVVADLSFISLTKVLPALSAVSADPVTMLPMVKPQFEAGRELVGKNGVVRDPSTWASAMRHVTEFADTLELSLLGAAPSRAPGPAGNIEFFLHLQRGVARDDRPDPADIIQGAVDAARAIG
ncbi:TlyA family RNA methyltransferase [Euzebya tangerina]|uniref:TlyA family RNA methyltransferase n=1 Tax=Euzebya tangerina TaxID=591198 RepID=UPI000E3116E1|nr:TlyA family RNA methyltransferase [Euzebya tangerina]